MKNYFLLIILLFCFLFIFGSFVCAKQSDEFVNFLSEKIYNDCRSKDITIKSVQNASQQMINHYPQVINYICDDGFVCILDLRERNGSSVRKIKDVLSADWPNINVEFFGQLLEAFSSIEPYEEFNLMGEEKQFPMATKFIYTDGEKKYIFWKAGDDLLKCGDHVLDINGTDYYWDDQRVELPRHALFNSLFNLSLVEIIPITILPITIISFVIFRKKIFKVWLTYGNLHKK